jgi:biopolymer transport protein ExbB
MKLIKKICVGLVAASVFTASSAIFAQQDDAGPSLEELVKLVQQAKYGETQEQRAREAEFRKDRSQQQSLLNRAENTKAGEEAKSEALEATHKQLEEEIQQLRALRDERLGSLNELFGHLTSTAGDLRSNINVSLVSAQYPGREAFLNDLIDKMNSETKLPTTDELEKLWAELQFEMVEGGRIVKFTRSVADNAGNASDREVVRIGNYNIVSDGAYLHYGRESGSLTELARQPKSNNSAALQAASDGFVKTAVDPTGPAGGQILIAMLGASSLQEKLWFLTDEYTGGVVGIVITCIGFLALLIALWRFVALFGMSGKVKSQLKSENAKTNNPLGRVLKVAEDNPQADTETLELKLEEAVLKEQPGIESMLSALKIISMVAPLLGLLGTVVGMIEVFTSITIYGAGDPKAMAGGISGALATTVLGLIVAIPTVLLHTYLSGNAKRISHILEEQSAGIIASKSEK